MPVEKFMFLHVRSRILFYLTSYYLPHTLKIIWAIGVVDHFEYNSAIIFLVVSSSYLI